MTAGLKWIVLFLLAILVSGARLNVRPGSPPPNITFVAATTTSSASGTLQCNVPAGTQNGDLILSYIANNSTTPFSVNNVWITGKSFTSGSLYALLQYRFASSEPASYSWTGLGTASECVMRTYRYAAPATPLDDLLISGSGGSSVTSQATSALVATASSNEMNVSFWANGTAQAITGPGGLSNISSDAAELGVFSGDAAIPAAATVIAAKTATVSSAAPMGAIALNLIGTSSPVPNTFAFSASAPTAGQTIAGTSSPFTGGAGSKWAGGTNIYLVTAAGLVKLAPSNFIPSGGSFSGSFDSTQVPNGPQILDAIAFSADGTPSVPIAISVVIFNNSALTFVGSNHSGNAAGSGAACTVNVPAGTSVGDALIAYVANQNTAPGPTPAGWTLAQTAVNTIQSASAYWKIAAAGDIGGSLNFTGLSFPECAIRAYHGTAAISGSPIDSTATCVAQSATTCPVNTLAATAASNEVQVGFWDFNPQSPAPICPSAFGNVSNIAEQRGFCMGDLLLGLQGVVPASQTATTTLGANYWDSVNVTLVSGPPTGPGVHPVPPSITTPPSSQTVAAGGTASFTVGAAGSPPLSYQWHRVPVGGGDNPVGANQASFATAAQTLAMSGDGYYVIVSNAAGAATSTPNAIVTVTSAPSSTFDAWSLSNPPPAPNNTKAVPAIAWLQSVGANVCGYTSCCASCPTAGSSQSDDIAKINFVGAKTLRAGDQTPTQLSYMTAIAQATGAKYCYLPGKTQTTATIQSTVIFSAKQLLSSGVLRCVELMNEPDKGSQATYNGVPCDQGADWKACGQYAADLHAAMRADPSLNGVALMGFSDTGAEIGNYGVQYWTIPASGAVTNGFFPPNTVFSDGGSQHNTNAGQSLTAANIQWDAADPCVNRPQYVFFQDYVTTWKNGYAGLTSTQACDVVHSPRISSSWNSDGSGDDAQGVRQVNTIIDYFARGDKATEISALIAPQTAPTQGLYNPSGGAAYPGANYFHSATHFMTDTGDVANPDVVNWSFASGCGTGGGSNSPLCHGLLLQKSASAVYNPGSHDLLVTYEPGTGGPPISLVLSLQQTFSHVNVYDLTTVVTPAQNSPVSPTPVATCTGCSSITIPWGYLGHAGNTPPPLVVEFF